MPEPVTSKVEQEEPGKVGTQVRMWSGQEIAEFYRGFVQQYDDDISSNCADYPAPFLIGRWVLEQWQSQQQQQLSKVDKIRVLDLGCGTGQSGVPFIQQSSVECEVVGVDATPEMLNRASQRGYHQVIVHDLEERPYPSQLKMSSFNVVLCVGVMDFIKEPVNFLNYCKQFLTSGGLVGLTLPERHQHSDLSSFSEDEMRQLLIDQAGFSRIIRHDRFMGYRDSVTGNIQYYHGWLCEV